MLAIFKYSPTNTLYTVKIGTLENHHLNKSLREKLDAHEDYTLLDWNSKLEFPESED